MNPEPDSQIDQEPVWQAPALPDDWESIFTPVTAEADEGDLAGRCLGATVDTVSSDGYALTLSDGSSAWCDIEDGHLPGDSPPVEGDSLTVLVDSEMQDGRWRVSIGRALLLGVYDMWAEIAASGSTVRGVITQVLRGGFAVEAEGVRAFVPGRHSGVPLREAFDVLGRSYDFKVLRFDSEDGQPVLTRRHLAETEARAARDARLENVREGEALPGRVTRLVPFGAFVDIGGVEGLLHISEMSLHHIERPEDAVRVGQELDVRVLRVDRERGRIGLSIRDSIESEQQDRIEEVEVGAVVDGIVKRLTDFGAFIEIPPGVEGLCHVSELSWTERPAHPSDVLEVGGQVQVRILETKPEERRISLSIRAVETDPWMDFREANPAGALLTGEITRIEPYGLFLRVADGIEGLCHVSDLTWEGRPETPAEAGSFSVGQVLEVRLLDLDLERRRLRLGLKQVSGDPWDDASELLSEGARLKVRIVRFEEQAAWAEIVPGLEGRIHISQISSERTENIRAALRIDQVVEVLCTTADRSRRRIDLSVRALAEAEERNAPRHHADEDASPGTLALAIASSGLATGEPDTSTHAAAVDGASDPEETARAQSDDEQT